MSNMFQFHYGINRFFFFFESDENYITVYNIASVSKGFLLPNNCQIHSVTQILLGSIICYILGWTLGIHSLIQELPSSLGDRHPNKLS